MEEITVVIGHRGGGQLLGVFRDPKKIRALQELTQEFHEEGYVSFFKVKVDEFQYKHFGLFFK